MVSGLAPRWAAQQPQCKRRVFSHETRCEILGPLRAPARGKPAHHNKGTYHNKPIRPDAKLPVPSKPTVASKVPVVSGLAPRWAAQQPQCKRRVLSYETRCEVLGPLRAPARGKPAHHNKGTYNNKPIRPDAKLPGPSKPTVAAKLPVVSGLAPRWAAQQPQCKRRVLSYETRCEILGPLRAPARGKPAHHNKRTHNNKPIRPDAKPPVPSEPTVAAKLPVVSGLAPRWAAQQPNANAAFFDMKRGVRF